MFLTFELLSTQLDRLSFFFCFYLQFVAAVSLNISRHHITVLFVMLKSTKLNRFFIFGEHNVIAASPLQSMRLVSRYVALTPGKLRHICVSFLDLIELYKTSFTRSYLVFIMVRKKNTLLQTVFFICDVWFSS